MRKLIFFSFGGKSNLLAFLLEGLCHHLTTVAKEQRIAEENGSFVFLGTSVLVIKLADHISKAVVMDVL